MRWLEELGGYACFDGLWAWGLALLGYRFHALSPYLLALEVLPPLDDGGGEEGGGGGEEECGCASSLSPRDVKATLWRFEQWVGKVRLLWTEVEEAEKGMAISAAAAPASEVREGFGGRDVFLFS